jgi:enoyl-CoA hydratase/carnithine racemase
VLHIILDRPKKLNTFSYQVYLDMAAAFKWVNESEEHDIRVVLVSARGKYFTAGIDLTFAGQIATLA